MRSRSSASSSLLALVLAALVVAPSVLAPVLVDAMVAPKPAPSDVDELRALAEVQALGEVSARVQVEWAADLALLNGHIAASLHSAGAEQHQHQQQQEQQQQTEHELGLRRDAASCRGQVLSLAYRSACLGHSNDLNQATVCLASCFNAYTALATELASPGCRGVKLSVADDASAESYLATIKMQFLPTSHLFCESGRAGSSPSTGMTLVGAGAARSVCGDRKCDATESCESCSVDCGTCRVCGDGFCSTDYETCRSCPHDCGVCPSCGDGVCNGNEHCDTCPNDCGECISCGDKVCNGRETCQNCWADCGACPTCGDGKCDLVVQGAGPTLFQYKETLVSCPLDCEPRNVTIYVIGRPENNSTEEQASRARRREEGMQASRELYEATAYTIKPFDLDPSFSPSAEHHAQLEAEWVELENARVAELKRRDAELFAPKPLSDDEIRELFPAYADAIIAQRMDQEIENELALYNEVRSPALKAHFASHETRQQAARESRAQQLALEARQEREQPKRIIIKHVDLQALHNRRRELPHLHQIFNSMSPPEEGLSYQVDGFVEDFEITEIITQVGSLDLNEPRPEQTVERVVASSDDSSVSSHGRRGVAPEPAAAEAAAAAASHPEDAVEPDATTTSHKIAILTAKQLQFLGVGAGVMLVVGLVSALASYRKHRRTTDIKPASTASPVAAKRSQPSASSVEAAAPEVLPVEKDVTAKDTTRSTVEVEKGTLRVLPGLPQLRESSACSTPEAETDTRRSIPGSSSPLSSPLRAR